MSGSRVTVITPGRFHSFDLAEQLQNAGRLAAIYTGYPQFKLRNTRIEPRLIRSFPWLLMPYLALARWPKIPQAVLTELAWLQNEFLDAYAARTLPECDLVIALSSSGLRAGGKIKSRGGAYICDRGSTHILWQHRVITEEYERLGMTARGADRRVIDKEQAEYDLADAITLPSRFAIRSFTEMGVDPAKLRLVPYGVNLATFSRSTPRAANFRVLFVGQLSVRKGLHYLLEAFRRANLAGAELVLVGGRTPDTDVILSRHSFANLTVTGALSREDVVREMSLASVMVLPSIEEGMALVQAQALACGCPVIATTHTGAEDIFEDGREGFIIAPRDIDSLIETLSCLYKDRGLIESMGKAGVERVKTMGGWDSYGRTMMGVFDEFSR